MTIMGWWLVVVMPVFILFVVVQSLKLCLTLCSPINCCTPGFPVLHRLLEFAQIHVDWVGGVIEPYYPLPSPSPFGFNLSQHKSFPVTQFSASDSQSIGASASVLPVTILGCFPLGFNLPKGTLKSLLQHHNSKASILWCSAFFVVQLSHPYMTAGKIIALTIWTFVGKAF